jgi:ribosomal protein L37AE/L43A
MCRGGNQQKRKTKLGRPKNNNPLCNTCQMRPAEKQVRTIKGFIRWRCQHCIDVIKNAAKLKEKTT